MELRPSKLRGRGGSLMSEQLTKVSLREKFDSFSETWSPKVVALVDEFAIKVVKIDGDFVWHRHEAADEVFFVISGGITMKYRLDGAEREVAFGPGELLRVPRGVEHMPVALPGTEIVLFERADLVNTGNVRNERTVDGVPI
jgi:mannose-6-phosphate isomerase-like protein (cupin superfamily)